MANHRIPLAALTALSLLAGCPAPTGTRPDAGAGGKAPVRPAASPNARQGVPIAGIAVAPAGIVAAGAGNLIGADGGSLVAASAGNILSHNGAQLSAGARSLLAVDQQPLAGAEVFLAGADGQPLPDIPSAVTDAQGRFRLAGAPSAETVTVQVRVKNKAGAATTLMTLVRPTAAGATANVSIGTTCVAVAVLDGQGGNLGEFNPAKFQSAVDTTDKELTPETWPDPADRQAILAAMSRLEAKIDLLQSTLDEIRGELQRLSSQVAGRTPAPAATAIATATPPTGGATGPTSAPSAEATPLAPGTTLRELALRAKLEGGTKEDLLVILTDGDTDVGALLAEDDGTVGSGIQLHLDAVTFPATFRVYAGRDATGLEAAAVRQPENLLGLLVATGPGAAACTFQPRAGAAVSLSGARLAPFFEAYGKPHAFTGKLSWNPPGDGTEAAPSGPFPVRVEAEGGAKWSARTPFVANLSRGLGDQLLLELQPAELPTRYRLDVTYTPAGTGTARTVKIGYIRVYRDYVTDAVRVRFDREDGSPFNFKEL